MRSSQTSTSGASATRQVSIGPSAELGVFCGWLRCRELTKVRSTSIGGPDQRRRYTLDQELSATCGPPEGLDEPLEMMP